MRQPGRVATVVVPVVLVAAPLLGWWIYSRPRVLTVCVVADSAFRRRADWKSLIEARFAAASRIYSRQVGIVWKIADDSSPDPAEGERDIDKRRARLASDTDCNADLVVEITGLPANGRNASVSPFSHGAVIVDHPEKNERENTLILAHELAHLFGAPHDPAPNDLFGESHDKSTDTLMQADPQSEQFSVRSAKLVRSLRKYDFAHGVDALRNNGWDARATEDLTDAFGGLSVNPMSQAHQIIAAALQADNRNSAAIDHLQAAVRADPQNGAARFNLVVALEQDGQEDAALPILRQGVLLQPNDPRLHSALGALLIKRNREEAIDEFMESIRLEPNNAEVYNVLGSVLAAGMGRIDQAIAAYRDALRIAPGMVQAQKGLQAALQSKAQAQSDAVFMRRRALQSPENASVQYDLGVAEARAGDFDAAAKALESATRIQPGYGLAHSSLALMRYVAGDYTAAWSEVKAARSAGTEPDPTLVAALTRKSPAPK